MNFELQAFLEDCERYSNLKRVIERIDKLPPKLKTIKDDRYGEEALKAGVALFAYLADVIVAKKEEGIKTWNIFKLGYPEHNFTDLMAPYFDIYRVRYLWINASHNLQTSPAITAEIVLNLYFRYYLGALELYRKMLVYAEYCRQVTLDEVKNFPFKQYLYDGKNPSSALKSKSTKQNDGGRGEAVGHLYIQSLRHALAHGNVIMAMPNLIAVRQTQVKNPEADSSGSKEKEFIQDIYRVDEMIRIIDDFEKIVEPCYQAINVFLIIYQWIETKHIKFIKKYSPERIEDEVIEAIVDVMNKDPEGLRFWNVPPHKFSEN